MPAGPSLCTPRRSLGCCLTAAAGFVCLLAGARPAEGDAAFFEKRVRPLLAEHCYQCHSGSEPESGLLIDSRAGLLRGGTRGPAIVPGAPEQSLLIRAVRHSERLQMPPKRKLKRQQIAALTQWIQQGALWPGEAADAEANAVAGASVAGNQKAKDMDAELWSLQAVVAPPLPAVNDRDWPQSPLDHFVLARLEAAGLTPAPRADKRTLIRRTTLDLLGLPPTPREIERFLSDDTPDAFARLVDRLLASPAYGERWGRHWLDVVRYADSNGLDENLAYVNAFRYRDYVIAALNEDRPYDVMICEQIAGDLLATAGAVPRGMECQVATGFLALGAKMLAEDDPVKMQFDIIDEQIDTLGRAMLGLSLGCARCHDHKFDPISSQDYYALAGIFKSTKTMNHHRVVAEWFERPVASQAEIATWKAHDEAWKKVRAAADALVNEAKRRLDDESPAIRRLQQAAAAIAQARPAPLPYAMGVTEGEVEDLRVHLRGSYLTLGETVPRGLPAVFTPKSTTPLDGEASGRLPLARWIASTDNPLTSRVMVNRIWRWHFGEGLVRTPDNFGRLGERPTHPQLLDYLAARFVAGSWSIKQLHRLLLLSSTYQMSAAANERALLVDPDNRLLWRWNRRRLEAEAVRDSLIMLGEGLDLQMGGSLMKAEPRAYVTATGGSRLSDEFFNRRRSVYLPVIRSALYEVLSAFDFADPSNGPVGDRGESVVPSQALMLMNSDLMASQAAALAGRLLEQTELDDASRIDLAYRMCFARGAGPVESTRLLTFLEGYREQLPGAVDAETARRGAWTALCRVLMSSNEFLYLN